MDCLSCDWEYEGAPCTCDVDDDSVYHLIYTLNGVVKSEFKAFENLRAAESYLRKIGATWWEIAVV